VPVGSGEVAASGPALVNLWKSGPSAISGSHCALGQGAVAWGYGGQV
jgi:hypothetical protein